MENIVNVTDYVRSSIQTIEVLHSPFGSYYYFDGAYTWRVYKYIPGTTYESTADLSIIKASGKLFGELNKSLIGFPVDTLHITIPSFHNISKRYCELEAAYKRNRFNRAETCQNEYKSLLSARDEACRIEQANLPLRVVHNDTKISNIVFTSASSGVVIDFDNVMPGFIWQDYGDAIRSICNTCSEDEERLDRVHFNLPAFSAFSDGYLEKTATFLSEEEWSSLPFAGFSLAYELATRFLTDYLCGDQYFHVEKDCQNLIRCRGQLALAEDMRNKMDEIQNYILFRRKENG